MVKRLEFVNDVSFKHLNENPVEGILSCGFMPKEPEVKSHNFMYYGGFIILSGKGRYIDRDGNSQVIGVGDFVQRQPGVVHTTTVEEGEPWLEFFVCFGSKLYESLTDMGIVSAEPVLHTSLTQETVKRCELLLYNFKSAFDRDVSGLLLQVQTFMFHMNALAREKRRLGYRDEMVDRICEELGSGFDRKVDGRQIAERYQIGYENLRKIFHSQTGTSLHQYRIMKRTNEAKRLLCYRELTLREISDMLGYTDQYAFSNQFKKITGMSPKVFRKSL